MSGQRELVSALRRAAQTVDEAELADDLRVVAFRHVLGIESVAVASPTPTTETVALAPRPSSEGGPLDHIVERLKLPSQMVRDIYEQEGSEVKLVVSRSSLTEPDSKAASMRDIALLVVAGRQAAGLEDYTTFEMIRDECRELNVYDQPNFASEVAKLEFRTRGNGKNKEARANRHHFERVAELISRICERDA